jgi:hypothetical protein
MQGKPGCLLSSLEEASDNSPLEADGLECGMADPALAAGVALLAEGSFEEVGPWNVRQSDFCEPCHGPEFNGVSASNAASDSEVPAGAGSCSESEFRKARPRHSFILVPAASIAHLTRRNSEPTVKFTALAATPPLPPMRRRASIAVPSLLDSSDDTEPVDLLFGAMPTQRPQSPDRRGWV